MDTTRHRQPGTVPNGPTNANKPDTGFKGIVNSFQNEVVVGDVVIFSSIPHPSNQDSTDGDHGDNGHVVTMVTEPRAEIISDGKIESGGTEAGGNDTTGGSSDQAVNVGAEPAKTSSPGKTETEMMDYGGSKTTGGDTFTVEQAIEQIGFGRFQLKMSAIICVIHMTDAGELMILSMLGPELQCVWHLTDWQKALITTVVFVGYLTGSPLWGMFADKFGRKKALIMVGFWIFFFGLLSSFSPTYGWMLFLRSVTGIGIGGAAQNVVLYSEFLPSKVRGFWLTLVSFSWILGVMWVVAVAYFVMPVYGWRWLLIVTAMPLLIFIFCCYFLPESAYYHVACGNKDEALKILQQLAKTNKKSMPQGELVVGAGTIERGEFKDLFCDRKTSITTSLLLFIWFTMAFVYYGVVLLTTELFAKGHSCAAGSVDPSAACYEGCNSLTKQDYAHLMYTTIAEIPGTLLTLGVIDYVGRKKTMSIQYVFCGLSIFLLFICTNKKILLTVFLFFARALIAGAFQGIYVYTPEVYPTHVRGIGLGTCGSIARIGCIVTPFVAQLLLGHSPHGTIGLYGAICFAAALAISLLPIETKGRKMISQVKEAKAVISESLHYTPMT